MALEDNVPRPKLTEANNIEHFGIIANEIYWNKKFDLAFISIHGKYGENMACHNTKGCF